MRAKIVVRNLQKTYPGRMGPIAAVRDFSLEVGEGEFLCLVGPSGCGKSTFLRMVAGLIPATAGEARVVRGASNNDKPLTSIVFQEYAIFPWKTVRQNVGFGLEMRGVPRPERLIEAGRNFGAQGFALFRHVIFPGTLPSIFTGLRLGSGTALLVIIAAEFVAANEGIGFLIWRSWTTLVTENMFVGLTVVACLGTLFTWLLHRAGRLIMPWQAEAVDLAVFHQETLQHE